jgi:hypothetical protein
MPNWFILEMTVGGSINLKNKHQEEHIHPQTVHPNVTTALLMLMCSKAVQGVMKIWDMETMPNNNHLSVEGYDGGVVTQDWGKGVIAHANLMSRDRIVRDEG